VCEFHAHLVPTQPGRMHGRHEPHAATAGDTQHER
jgi:hypothetical protein